MLELKLLLKSEVFPATPTAWLGPSTRQQSPLSNLTSGKGAPGRPPQPWLWNLERTGEKLQRSGIMNYPVPPGRPRFLLRSGRSWLTCLNASWPRRRRSCRGHQSIRVRVQDDQQHCGLPGPRLRDIAHPNIQSGSRRLTLTRCPGRLSAPPSGGLGAGARSRLYLLECLTYPNCSTLTVVIWLLGRQGAKEA